MAPIRLLNVNTFEVKDTYSLSEQAFHSHTAHADAEIKYGIVSHKWLMPNSQEVQFDDLRDPTSRSTAQEEKRSGFAKIIQTCELAKAQGLKYIWLDTCCINKTNPTEIQESINSMYQWYQEAQVCFVYLAGTDAVDTWVSMKRDEWFTRGWTLLELIAPREVQFYDKNWKYLGDKEDLKELLQSITKINPRVLDNSQSPRECSIAARMSWACDRVTTKAEDRAYSLFGIFGVNLPTLYGEGARGSFRRLQEEIMKNSDDHSIFAWTGVQDRYPGLLAESLDQFRGCGSMIPTRFRRGKSSFSLTNRGISITLNLEHWTLDTYMARIHCIDSICKQNDNNKEMTGIFLRRLDEDDQYARIQIDGKDVVQGLSQPPGWSYPQANSCVNSRDVSIFVRQDEYDATHAVDNVAYGFTLGPILLKYIDQASPLLVYHPCHPSHQHEKRTVMDVKPLITSNPKYDDALHGIVAQLDLSEQDRCWLKGLIFCLDFDFNPVVFFTNSRALASGIRQDRVERLDHALVLSQLHGSKPQSIMTLDSLSPELWQVRGDRLDALAVMIADTGFSMSLRKMKTAAGLVCWEFDIMKIEDSSRSSRMHELLVQRSYQ